jgi:hypothetical protein
MEWMTKAKNALSKAGLRSSPRDAKRRIDSEILEHRGLRVEIKREPYRRSLSIAVRPSGHITVTTSKSTSISEIVAQIDEQRAWIKGNLKDFEELRNEYPPKFFQENEPFLFLGENLFLQFRKTRGPKKTIRVSSSEQNLICEIPEAALENMDSSSPNLFLRKPIQNFYKACGKEILSSRVKKYSELTGLLPSSLTFRAQKTLWGSCGSSGSISLNWKLAIAPLTIIDYVVIHELCHLKHLNHSKKFWALVGEFCPDHKKHEEWLKNNKYEFDFLAKKSELYPDHYGL